MLRTAPRLLLTALLATSSVACATKVAAPADAPALGSDARIVAKKNKTGTYAVSVELMNLAPPSRLDPAAQSFVVWFVAGEEAPVRAGVLAYDEGDRRGALEATTPGRVFDVMITLEKEPAPAEPSPRSILRAKVAAR
ncbi:MAG: hypothetical protein R3B09_00145 [Nannocystaceae bacterium]